MKLAALTEAEQAIVAQVELECEGLRVNHRPFALWKELTARTLAEARKIDAEMAATARVKLYQAAHALLAAGGLTPASFDKVSAGEDKKGAGGPRVSLRGDPDDARPVQ